MGRVSVSRILALILFAVFVVSAAHLDGQPVAIQLGSPSVQGQYPRAQNRSAAEGHPACQRILNECRRLGFVYGQWKKDNGLYRDCFDPVVNGGTATREGKPIQVPVSPNDLQACRAARAHRR